MRVARLLRCQGSAPCIIATIWSPESHLRTSQDKVENELWAKCARRALAGFASPKSCRSAAKECTFPPYKTPSKATSKCKDHALVVPGWHFGEAQVHTLIVLPIGLLLMRFPKSKRFAL